MAGGLLVRVRDPKERRLAPRAAEEGDAHGEPGHEAHGDADVGVPGDRRRARAASAVQAVPLDVVRGPGQVHRRRDDRVELVLVHERVDPVLAVGALDRAHRVQVLGVGERTARLGRDHALLPEVRHLAVGVALVEVDDLGEALDRRVYLNP